MSPLHLVQMPDFDDQVDGDLDEEEACRCGCPVCADGDCERCPECTAQRTGGRSSPGRER